MSELLKIENLKKNYKDKKAVDGISFDVCRGEILCILGPNGAGKSTAIHMLTGALRPDSGTISSGFTGKTIQAGLSQYKRRLGIVPQDLAIYEDLSAEQNVLFFASLYGLKGAALKEGCRFALELAGLSGKKKDRVNTFSGGMKRRLNIACAIGHRPDLLIMDEPTVGIDPQSRNHILQSIKCLRDGGMTVIYTTHYMEEVEEISTRIIIMDHGTILASGTKEKLKEGSDRDKIFYIEAGGLDSFHTDALYLVEGVRQVERENDRLKVITIRSIENLDRMIALLMEHNVKINSLVSEVPSLETVFLNLTGRTLRD